jgi:hypothetical protein
MGEASGRQRVRVRNITVCQRQENICDQNLALLMTLTPRCEFKVYYRHGKDEPWALER